MRTLALCAATLLPALSHAQALDAPYVPTPNVVVQAMLKLANVNASDFVVDLGSGDGRIVIAAAKQYGARGFGVDLDAGLVHTARREAKRQGVADKVEFHARNLFITEIAQATVLTTYLYPRINMQLRPRLFAELRPGTRVVSHEFDFGNWQPDVKITVPVPDKPYGPPSSDVLMWIMPANAAGRWQWSVGSGGGATQYQIALEQTFQMLQGKAQVAGRPVRVETARLRGAELTLVLVEDIPAGGGRHELSGRVEGDTIRGTARIAGQPGEIEWRATRVAPGKINIDAAGPLPAFAAN